MKDNPQNANEAALMALEAHYPALAAWRTVESALSPEDRARWLYGLSKVILLSLTEEEAARYAREAVRLVQCDVRSHPATDPAYEVAVDVVTAMEHGVTLLFPQDDAQEPITETPHPMWDDPADA